VPIPDLLLPVAAILWLAGLVQGLSGFGSALLAVPLLALLLPLATLVPLVSLLGLVIALLNLPHLRHALRLAPVLRLLLGYLCGAPLGLLVLTRLPQRPVLGALGLFLTAYALFSLSGRQPQAAWLREWRVGLGVLSGALGTAFSTNGPPVILHVAAHREWSADQQKATLVLFFLLSGLITAATHGAGGLINAAVGTWLMWGIPPLALGTWTGIALYRRLGDHQYRRLTFLLILATGVLLSLRALQAAAA
jgi:uncharacterized membrane protein YfcA